MNRAVSALGLRRDLAARLRPLAALLVVVIAVSAPLAIYLLGRRAVRLEALAAARQVAQAIENDAETRPLLWKYDTLKLLGHLRTYHEHEHIERIEVVDAFGDLIDDGVEKDLPALARRELLWERAPIMLEERTIGAVWVGAHTGGVKSGALQMLGVFTLLGLGLAGLMVALPRRAMFSAEERIGALLERLQRSQQALAESADNLEQQVEARSSELSRALRELQDKEQRVRELSARAVSMQEAERRAIARELHDSAGQALTAIRIHLQLIGDLVTRMRAEDAAQVDRARDLAARTATMVDETLEEIRRAVNTLGPAVLDDVGLSAAISRACDDLADSLGIEVDCEVRVPEKLPPVIETTCYRLVQEALTNIARHAAAGHVEVRVESGDTEVRVRVQDDGRGFDPAEERTRPSRGVVGMRERAELLGGRLDIDSAPGAGTTVRAQIPRS
jgi:signal transduction histidine kinase